MKTERMRNTQTALSPASPLNTSVLRTSKKKTLNVHRTKFIPAAKVITSLKIK